VTVPLPQEDSDDDRTGQLICPSCRNGEGEVQEVHGAERIVRCTTCGYVGTHVKRSRQLVLVVRSLVRRCRL
jgi:uncharacterized Zn finger protein